MEHRPRRGHDQVPKTYTDLLTNFRDGNLGFTIGDFDWLYGMVGLLQQEGHSEEDAMELLRIAATAVCRRRVIR